MGMRDVFAERSEFPFFWRRVQLECAVVSSCVFNRSLSEGVDCPLSLNSISYYIYVHAYTALSRYRLHYSLRDNLRCLLQGIRNQ